MNNPLRILSVEDSEDDVLLILTELRGGGFEITHERVETKDAMVAALAKKPWDIILSDYTMPKFSAPAALKALRQGGYDLPFIVVSGSIGEDIAVNMMKEGAHDYLLKQNLTRLVPAVRRELADAENRRQRRQAEERTRRLAADLRYVLEAADELIRCVSTDTLYRRAIELAREKLGIERCAIFIRDGDTVHGTYGTDMIGNTVDERECRRPLDPIWAQRFEPLAPGAPRSTVLSEPRTYWTGDQAKVADTGWVAVTPIQSSGESVRVVGVFVNDSAISNASFDDVKQEVMTVYCSILANIIDRRTSEEKIREQAALLDITRDAIMVLNLNREIVYWNKAAERLYGWSAHELFGKGIEPLLTDAGRARLDQEIDAFYQAGYWNTEWAQVTKSGVKIIVQSRWTMMLDDNRQAKAILVVNTDVTESKEIERRLMRSQRLNSLGALAGGISHDLNNILSPILMGAQLLKMKVQDPDSQTWLNLMENSVNRGADLVKQVLCFSRGTDEGTSLLQLRTTIKEVAKFLGDIFPKNVHIETAVPDDLWLVSGNVTQYYQLLLNLIVNARDAMPNGGRVRIASQNLSADQSYAAAIPGMKEGAYILIAVEDTGVGIPMEIQAKIFEPFFTTKEEGKGTGLGLATVADIVKNRNGVLTIDSELNRGTLFKIYLPAEKSVNEDRAETRKLELPKGHGEGILVIDDEVCICELTKEILDLCGYRCFTANNGAEAITLLGQHRESIRIVLTDTEMPIMDGPATVRVVRQMNSAIKVMGMSGGAHAHSVIAHELKKAADAFIAKPFTAEELLISVTRLLDEMEIKG